MKRTPGYIIPSEFPNTQAAIQKLHETDKAAGFTSLDMSLFHSSDLAHILVMLAPHIGLERGNVATDDDILAHYGVLGMKWGVRNVRSQAESDANEHTKAKLFYGEGAGTRRKLIKAKVEQRSKNPEYKRHFDAAVARQNLDKRAAQATRTRNRKDAVKGAGKVARGIHRSISGPFAGSITVAAAAAGYSYARSKGYDKAALSAGSAAAKVGVAWLKSQGVG